MSPDDAIDMSMADLQLASDKAKGHKRGPSGTGYADVHHNEKLKDNRPDVVGRPGEVVHPHPKDKEKEWQPAPGQAVAAPADSEETRLTHEEMSKAIGQDVHAECPFMATQK